MPITATNPLHSDYELFAKQISIYFNGTDAQKQQAIALLNSSGYTIGRVFNDPTTSFQAIGLLSNTSNRPPVIIFQGTSDSLDAIDDANPNGVGFNQFTSNKAAVRAWLASVGTKVDLTGYSLGGALAQWFASESPDLLRELVTFQSSGITAAAGTTFTNKGGVSGQVTHYVVNGDLVSLAGEAFLPGTLREVDYQTTAYDPSKFINKHFAGIFRSNLFNGVTETATTELSSTLADFNQPGFTFSGKDWQDFTTRLKQGDPILGAGTDSRTQAEGIRANTGDSNTLISKIDRALITGITGLNITDTQLIKTNPTISGIGIQAISQKSSRKIGQIVAFTVDDATGRINGLNPSLTDPAYFQAVLGRAKPILTTLSGEFLNTNIQEIALEKNKFYQFIDIKDGSLADLQEQIRQNKIPTNAIAPLFVPTTAAPIQISDNDTPDGFRLSLNNDELVLKVVKLAGLAPAQEIGSQLQNTAEGRLLDLTGYSRQTLKVALTTKSSAAYNNNIGFYAVENAAGDLRIDATTVINTTDSRYAVEAVKKAILNAKLTVNKNGSNGGDIAGGAIYAPVVIAQGTLEDFVAKNSTNGGKETTALHAYFNYTAANPDSLDHFRSLGSNSFGVEDLYGGGDRDFNDLIVNLKVTQPGLG